MFGVTIQVASDKLLTPGAAVPGFGAPYVSAEKNVTPAEVVEGLTQTG